MRSHHLDADRGVVARESLADVVQEGPDQQEVGPIDGVGETGRQCGGLQQMTVDGVGVVGVALGLVPDRGPFGNQADEQSVLVQRLDLVDGGPAEAEQVDEGGERLLGPRIPRRGHAVGQAMERCLGDGPVRPGGGRRQAQGERGVVGDRGQGSQGYLPVDLDHVGPQIGRNQVRGLVGRRAAETALGLRARVPQAAPTPHVVTDPCDLAPGRRDGEHQCVGVLEPERGCDLVLVLQQQLVVLTLGQPMELHPDIGQERRGAVDGRQVRVILQERGEGRDGPQHADVAQTAVTLLQVGLEQEGHVAGGGPSFGHLLLEEWEVAGTEPVAPGGAGLLQEGLDDLGLTPDEPSVEQAERHPHVLGGGGEHLGGPADRVVEVDPLVPDRVPDGVGDLGDVPVSVVDEHHIEVAVGAEGAPAVAAHGDEGQVPAGRRRQPVRPGRRARRRPRRRSAGRIPGP